MTKQHIYFTEPNDLWLESLVVSGEYSSKSEVVNDLIHKEREKQKELQWLRAKLLLSEQRLAAEGPIICSPKELLVDIKGAVKENE